MKTLTPRNTSNRALPGTAVAFCGLLLVASAGALADRGRGSIRAASRQEPTRPQPARGGGGEAARGGEARGGGAARGGEQQRGAPREAAHVEPGRSDAREQRAAPVREETRARPDWDEHDEPPAHF